MATKRSAQTRPAAAAPMTQPATPAAGVTPTAAPTRIPQRLDPLKITAQTPNAAAIMQQLLPTRLSAVNTLHLGVAQVAKTLTLMQTALAQPTLPDQLFGVLLQPDGSPAGVVQIQFDPSTIQSGQYAPVTTLTDDTGNFTLRLPHGLLRPATELVLAAHGANGNSSVAIPPAQIAVNGLVGSLALGQILSPLPVSIIASLNALVSATAISPASRNGSGPFASPKVTLGEEAPCQISYEASSCVDSFPYGVLFRLVEPRTSVVNIVEQIPIEGSNPPGFWYAPTYQGASSYQSPLGQQSSTSAYVDRIPVDQPISVDGFRDQIIGLGSDGNIADGETVPMAGTLGLGYVLRMSQKWKLKGLGLGNLVYSLPLAPGEQQEMAIFERSDTAAVVESETFSEQAAQAQSAVSDTSTLATFQSAIDQMQKGGSTTNSSSGNAGVAVGGLFGLFGVSGGAGTSSSGGTSSSFLSGQTDTAQSAAEQTHSAVANQASARVNAARASMRMATATENESVVTKVITNHNHTRALTMQYWEVLRLYNVETVIDGVTLVCLVPLEVVRFLPVGQQLTIQDASYFAAINAGTSMATLLGLFGSSTSGSSSAGGAGVSAGAGSSLPGVRQLVLARYANVIKHVDVLIKAVPRRYQRGLILLRQFVSDPTATVETYGGLAEDVIQFTLTGTFLPCEDIYITAVTNSNTRVGPVQLAGSITPIPANRFSSQDELLAYLRTQRRGGSVTLNGSLALPASMNRNDIIGFEIRREFDQVDSTLVHSGVIGSTISLQPSDLESALGGPQLQNFSASILEYDASGNVVGGGTGVTNAGETYASDTLNGIELPPEPYPLPALRVAPVLRFNQILEIEKMLQHVVRNTVDYSKAVWLSLTVEERAIMLEGYTLGVPPGGVADPTQMVPLLNCVTNEVLGLFGNSMVMPFIIPETVALSTGVTSSQIQNTLMNFHKNAFLSPCSCFALPTKGVLGEAVLGSCPSAEKLDLTRFWNWQDSPADSAPAIASTTLPTTPPSIAAGLTAPNSLTNLTPLINNIVSAPVPNTSLAQALAATPVPTLNAALTGATGLAAQITGDQTAASSARSDAVKQAGALSQQALATVGNIVGGVVSNGVNFTAGSGALAALTGATPPAQPAAKAAKPAAGKVVVTPSLTAVSLSPLVTSQLTATDVAGNAVSVTTWTVVPPTSGKVSSLGVFTPTATGIIKVTATLADGTSGSVNITVT